MVRVAIVGASGYGALELIRILLRHPEVQVTMVVSRDREQPPVATLHPSLTKRLDLQCEPFDPDEVAKKADVTFLSLPHGAAMAAAAPLLERGMVVIDLSADYRLANPATYAEWYGAPHADRANLAKAVYGLPEWNREQIRAARLVANPGCYPTSAILPLAPLLKAGAIQSDGIIIDSKSGVSGAGRTPKLMYHFPECNESVQAYNIGRHRHTPEIEQALSRIGGSRVEVTFTPHLIPMDRGIFSTIYAPLARVLSEDELLAILRSAYADEPFVRVIEHLPATKDTLDTNFCDITARVVHGRAILLSCLDNMVKGAAGTAVHNLNLIQGFAETAGLG